MVGDRHASSRLAIFVARVHSLITPAATEAARMSITTSNEETTRAAHKIHAARKIGAEVNFGEVNEGKSDFDAIYNAPDPRGYCRALGKLDYRIPSEAKPIFRSLIHALQSGRHDPVHIVDIGCSYGINAALLKYGMNLSTFFKRYTASGVPVLPDEMLRRETDFFDDRNSDGAIEVVGIDVSGHALDFARTVGLLDHTIEQNLEDRPLTDANRDLVDGVDLIISTGCVGYVSDKTFRHVMDAAGDDNRAPYVASFVLRMFPYAPIANALSDYGLVTEKLQDVTFRQRRFENEDERAHVFEQLRARGLEPSFEDDGYYHAEFFLSRPAAEAKARPLGYLL